MSIEVEFTVPAAKCALGRSLGGDPDVRIEIDRIVPTGETIMPFFWLWGGDCDDFERVAKTEPGIDDISVVDTVENGALFRATWNTDVASTLKAIENADGVLLGARADHVGWRFEVRFPSTDHTSLFNEYCAENSDKIEIVRVTPTTGRDHGTGFGLTDAQSEALAVAYRLGYFNEPREATLEAVAAELDISPRAVAGRLRRGQAALLEHTGLTDAKSTENT
ncbi:MAG: bacterio-opsin activator domain-containing protein [Halobacteriota archaeon]